jgi:alpha-D-ribose 1-methylphosphonate 5-triphosphate synthase subunit PhnH
VSATLASFSSSTKRTWLEFLDSCHHVFLPIQLAHDGIELEFDSKFPAPVADAEELFNVLSSSASDENVGLLVKLSQDTPRKSTKVP